MGDISSTSLSEQEKQLEDVLVRLDEAWGQLFRRVAVDLKECTSAIPLMQMGLLRLLDGGGAQRMSDIATRLDLTQSGCTALVDRAIQSGLVERYPHADRLGGESGRYRQTGSLGQGHASGLSGSTVA